MSTDLEQRLRDALREDAARARLVNPDEPPAPDVPPLIIHGPLRRWPRRLVAVAAVIALLAVAGVLVLQEDDQTVDTSPVTEGPLPEPRTVVGDGGCPFGIEGDPVVMQGVPPGTRFEALAGQTVAYTTIGAQVVVVSVPAFERGTDQAWQDEAVELERGPATLWLDGPRGVAVTEETLPFTQLRYTPGSEEPCSSFTVSVEGGGAEEQRQTAVDFAERVLLTTELDDPVAGLELAGTVWRFIQTSDGPVSSDIAFTADTVSWDTGCERLEARYELDRAGGFLVLTDVQSISGTCGPPTTFGVTEHYPIIDAVLHDGPIPIRAEGDRLYLGEHPDGDYVVVSRSAGTGDLAPPTTLPPPGEQPADPASAEAQVRDTYLTILDTTIPEEDRAPLSERPAVWRAGADDVKAGPNWELVQSLRWTIDEVVFVTPTHAALSFGFVSSDDGLTMDFVGNALLVDGRWVVAISTSCELFSAAGASCDMNL